MKITWTPENQQLLRDHYADLGADGMIAKFWTGASRDAIKHKANALRLKLSDEMREAANNKRREFMTGRKKYQGDPSEAEIEALKFQLRDGQGRFDKRADDYQPKVYRVSMG